MSTASEAMASRPRPAAPRLNLLPEPPAVAPARTRRFRWSWLAGFGLLGVTAWAANYALQSGSPNGALESSSAANSAAGAPVVVCHGTVDVEGQLRPIAPTQLGEISDVPVTEGQTVKEGDVLLRINDEPAKLAVGQAEAAVKASEAQVAQAKQGIEQLRLLLEKQQSGIDAAQAKLSVAESQLKRLEALKKEALTNENDLAAARNTVVGFKAALAAELTQYRSIQAMQPEDKLREAEAGLELARQRLSAERYKLDQCTKRAPCDGTILRINVAKGTLITPQMREVPMLLCPAGPRIVRAEMLPEFANRVAPGMDATINDESNAGFVWRGKVKRVADAFLPPRKTVGNDGISLNGNDSKLLECTVELAQSPNPPRIGQRVRVSLGNK